MSDAPTSPPTTAGDDEASSSSSMPFRYDARLAGEIETRRQAQWEAEGVFRTPNPDDPDFDGSKPKYFCLDMFPYPSGAGLHVGHPEGYTATDIVSRYKRLCGFNVLHPMGWDAFGLPAEQYAIQTGVHPAETTGKAIDTFRRQLKRFGFSYDWEREFATIDEDYYRWTQWIWLQAYGSWYDPDQHRARPVEALRSELEAGRWRVNAEGELVAADTPKARAWSGMSADEQRGVIDDHRLAYVGEQTVNWCPKLGTALANEEVIDGRSERGGHPVLRRPLRQWMFRITAFADRLLADLEGLDWPDSTKKLQSDWIGRSEGAEIDFPLADPPAGAATSLRVYTTRPDTVFGATYMVLAPEHPLVEAMLAAPRAETDVEALRAYVETAKNRSDVDRVADVRDKTGVATGFDAENPATGERIPVWVADYVLMGYGHGAIMAVPAHDERDFAFARAFGLPIVAVVEPASGPADPDEAFTGEGRAVNSANDAVSLDGLGTAEAKARCIEWLDRTGGGRPRVNFKLRDWLFSRQRYWGEPFPIVYDADGHHHGISADHLPVRLPEMTDYHPVESDEPTPLLATAVDWLETTAGDAGVTDLPPDAPVRRETNTMPGWAGSCWYYLRFCSPRDGDRFVDRAAERYWMGEGPEGGVDLYVGGAEHAVLHLLYARFWHKILYDLGHVSTPEPMRRLFHQGMITSYAYQRGDRSLVPADEVDERDDGTIVERATGEAVVQVVAKMSKSLKNVINPDEMIEQYGADTFRLYEMYMGPLEASKPWNTRDMIGLFRFLQRTWRLFIDERTGEPSGRVAPTNGGHEGLERALHRAIAGVADDIEKLRLNTAIAKLIELGHELGGSKDPIPYDVAERFLVILSPFAPHLAEELWSRLGHETSIALATWPEVDASLLTEDTIELPVQILGKVRGRITVAADADPAAIEAAALADERIAALLADETVKKVIVVPGRIVNVIV